jgi:hypothetical protein
MINTPDTTTSINPGTNLITTAPASITSSLSAATSRLQGLVEPVIQTIQNYPSSTSIPTVVENTSSTGGAYKVDLGTVYDLLGSDTTHRYDRANSHRRTQVERQL